MNRCGDGSKETYIWSQDDFEHRLQLTSILGNVFRISTISSLFDEGENEKSDWKERYRQGLKKYNRTHVFVPFSGWGSGKSRRHAFTAWTSRRIYH